MVLQNSPVVEIILTNCFLKGDFPFYDEISDKNLYPMILYTGSCQDFFQSAPPFREESVSFIGGRRSGDLSTFNGYLWTDSYLVLIKLRIQSII